MNDLNSRQAVFPGSFDPITDGHVSIIEKASLIFDSVTVLLAENQNKKSYFSVEKRIKFISDSVKYLPNVSVDYTSGFVTSYCEKNGIGTIIRSFRDMKDLSYEYELINQYKSMSEKISCVLFSSDLKYKDVSSTFIRTCILEKNFCKIKENVPEKVYKEISSSCSN